MCRKGTVKGDKGKFEKRDEEIDQAKSNLRGKFDQIKGEIMGLVGSLSGGGGSLPCPEPVSVLGRTISFCVATYGSEMNVIGLVVYFAAAVGSAFIIFKR